MSLPLSTNLIWILILNGVLSKFENRPLLANLKNQELLTLKFRGVRHDSGLSEDADVKASEGSICSLEAFLFSANFADFSILILVFLSGAFPDKRLMCLRKAEKRSVHWGQDS